MNADSNHNVRLE